VDVLYLTEAEVERLLTMEMALEALEAAFRAAAAGKAANHPRPPPAFRRGRPAALHGSLG